LCENSSDRVIGCAGITPFTYAQEANNEFGFALGKFAWGQGYATEIAQHIIKQAFEVLIYARLYATVRRDNYPSKRVLEKLGMQLVEEIEVPERGKRLVYCIQK
jgi:RimJ/RimL family protein N-acetyltransferase